MFAMCPWHKFMQPHKIASNKYFYHGSTSSAYYLADKLKEETMKYQLWRVKFALLNRNPINHECFRESNQAFQKEDLIQIIVKKDTNTSQFRDLRNSEPELKPCDTIHLGFVCGGFNSTRSFYVLLKSILFYRSNKIHLHIFVDNISRLILHELFDTWLVPDLNVTYYNMSNYERDISWISSQHYSNRFGLMKLVFLTALFEETNLSEVVVLDTDMLVLGNIKRLWLKFTELKQAKVPKKAVFGMVENQSDWYLGKTGLTSGTRKVWPAIGRGYNSGLIMADLIELKKQSWHQTWRQVAESELTSHLSTVLADQDIFNAVIRLHNHMIYELPCSFNIQLNDRNKWDQTCSDSDFKIVHWNSPLKFSTKNPQATHFMNWYLSFRNWDAKLLEQSSCKITLDNKFHDEITDSYSDIEYLCREIRPRPQEKLRTYLYFMEYESEPIENDVTFVVHLSLDRLQVLDQLAFHWRGPISVAIYLSELESNLLLETILSSGNLAQRKNIGYHLVFRDHGFNYPINKLRNIALENTLTSNVFLSDIDFLPSLNLYDYLRKTISYMKEIEITSDPLAKRALVIPAFESSQYKFEFPSSKPELLTQLNLGLVSMFRDQIWPQGHLPTDYAKWKTSTKAYKVDWRPEYEPFIVTKRDIPRYDERFVGFGWNKVESIMQLAALDYEFIVLPEAFVIHKFHSASFDIMQHRESFKYRACVKQLKRIFLLELRARFPDFFKTTSATNNPSTID